MKWDCLAFAVVGAFADTAEVAACVVALVTVAVVYHCALGLRALGRYLGATYRATVSNSPVYGLAYATAGRAYGCVAVAIAASRTS